MFTYDDNLTTDRDLLRFLIGDKYEEYARYTDEELDALLAQNNNDPYMTPGWALRLLGHTPSKLMAVRDAVAGGIPMATLLKMYADFGDRWLG